MSLPSGLISDFVKVTKDEKKTKSETTVYGTTVEYNESIYVRLDGSSLLTPIVSTVNAKPGDRVMVLLKNHTATVTGNITSPAAGTADMQEAVDKITQFEIAVGDKVSTAELDAERARIDTLESDNTTIKQKLTVAEASITELEADNVTINEKLTANEASIADLLKLIQDLNSRVKALEEKGV